MGVMLCVKDQFIIDYSTAQHNWLLNSTAQEDIKHGENDMFLYAIGTWGKCRLIFWFKFRINLFKKYLR